MDLSSPAAVVPAPISPNSLIKRLKRDMEEAPLSVIDDETFSCMLNTFEKLVQMQYPSIQVVDSIKLICNILWSSIYIECPKQFLNENVLKEWMSLFLIVLEGPVPLEGQPADIECRSLRQWLKDSEEIEAQRQKDGALLAFGALSKRILFVISHFELLDYLESYVLPEITNRGTVGHLRAKAVWVVGVFASDLVCSPGSLHVALNAVIVGMGDPEYPVCCNSVIALCSFVQTCDRTYPRRFDTYLDVLIPRLSELVNGVLRVMDKSVNTDLVYTIKTIVETFAFENTAPYALQLRRNLAVAFWNYMNIANGNGNEEVYNQAVSAALCCLRAILRTLEASSSNHHCEYVGIEPLVLPIMRRMLTTEGREMYEEVLEIVSYMLAFPPSVSRDMWSLWPLIADASVMWVIEFFTYISYVLQNYISKGTHNFLTSKELDYQQSLEHDFYDNG